MKLLIDSGNDKTNLGEGTCVFLKVEYLKVHETHHLNSLLESNFKI